MLKLSNIWKKIYGYKEGKRFIIDAEPILKEYTELELMKIASYEEKLKNVFKENRQNEKLINGIEEKTAEKLLEWIVQNVRQQLNRDGKIKEKSLLGYCGVVQSIIVATLNNMGLTPNISNVNPTISTDGYRHAFVTVEIPVKDANGDIENKLYLIDPTYRQFFLREEIAPTYGQYIKDKKFGNKVAALAGYWAIKMPNGIKFSEKLLSKGFIELTEENAKIYGDSFVLETKNRGNHTKVPKKHEIITRISGKSYIENMLNYSLQEDVEYHPVDLKAVGINLKTPGMQKAEFAHKLNKIIGQEEQISKIEQYEK